MKNRKNKLIVIVILILIFIVCFGLFAQSLINKSEKVEKRVYLNYQENSSIDYDVYLKENEFYSVNSLNKGFKYIALLSDYVNVDFNYNMNFADYVDGEYDYYVKATLVTREKDSSNTLWQESYILKEKVYEELSNDLKLSINENLDIDYNTYYQMINDFRSRYSVLVDSTLNVELIINSKIDYGKFKNVVVDQKSISVTIPLSDITYEISEYNGNINESNSYSEITEEGRLNEKLKYIGYVMWGIDILVLLVTLIFVHKFNANKNLYASKLKKILKNYDSVIAAVKVLPNLSNLNVIHVENFEDFIDVQNELRIPISFIETSKGYESWFIIIHQNEAWVYRLNALDLNKNKKEIFKI